MAEELSPRERYEASRDRARLLITVYAKIDQGGWRSDDLLARGLREGEDWWGVLDEGFEQGHFAQIEPELAALSDLSLTDAGKRALLQEADIYPDIYRQVVPQTIERSGFER